MRFEVVGYNKYRGHIVEVESSSQKGALTMALKGLGIYNNSMKLVKLTNKENQKCLDKGIDPSLMIDFTVENLDSENPMVSIGNWHIDI